MIQVQPRSISVQRHQLTADVKSVAFLQLSRLLIAGVSLSDALDDIRDSDESRVSRKMWAQVGLLVRSGESLSQSLSLTGFSTEKTALALIAAGENSGDLANACNAVHEFYRWQHNLGQRLVTLLIYPLFSLCVLVGVVGFLLVSVVPAIEGFLVSAGGELQWHTLVLLAVSDWVAQHYIAAVTAVAGMVAILFLFARFNQQVRYWIDAGLVKMPVIGKVISDLSLSRYARCCAQLYSSAVPLETSLKLAEATVANLHLRVALSKARHSMVSGLSLADSMRSTNVMPSLLVRLVAIGEHSGQLADVLTQFSEQQSATAESSIKRMEQLIGPALLLMVGSVLLWIVISVLGPVYNVAVEAVVGAA